MLQAFFKRRRQESKQQKKNKRRKAIWQSRKLGRANKVH
jgi:hypothetical protein